MAKQLSNEENFKGLNEFKEEELKQAVKLKSPRSSCAAKDSQCTFSGDFEKINISKLQKAKKGKSKKNLFQKFPAKRSFAIRPINIPLNIGIQAQIRENKAPDPFEDAHFRTESQLKYIISNTTTNPENPFYHLRQCGANMEATQKAYRHFIISLFESMCFIKEMRENQFEEELIAKQKLVLKKPESLKCKIISLDDSLI